jgi:hypothetical protein
VLKPTIFREYDIRGVADVVAHGSKAEFGRLAPGY